MSNLDINRFIQFVSLDTHPANNALVVTYEILVTVCERSSGRELARGNKRHSFQVQLSALDKLSEPELKTDKVALSLTDLSAEIRRKCPLLASQSEEEIQLHLLYLLNRRRSQLSETEAQQVVVSSAPAAPARRLRSANQSARLRQLSTRSSAGSERNRLVAGGIVGEFTSHGDVYSYLKAKELSVRQDQEDVKLDYFLERLDEQLRESCEEEVQVSKEKSTLQLLNSEQLDSLLESLYGDQAERLTSIVAIRRLTQNEQNGLLALTSNRLLVCAILRTLRDSQRNHKHIRNSILYILIRFTTFQDVYARICLDEESSSSSDDLGGLVLDLLVAEASEKSWPKTQKDADQYYQTTTCLLIIINNLIRHDAKYFKLLLLNGHPLARSNSFVCSLIELFVWASRRLTREIQLLAGPEALIYLVKRLLELMKQLTRFREFISELRSRRQVSSSLWDSISNLLDSIQASRPSSGMDASLALENKRISSELYELELELLQLLNNLMLDQRLKLQLIRLNFLKIVLRSLVVFLASSHSSLTFDKSAVLLVPFKSLYELTLHPKARMKIFESRIIMKCLLEYLLATSKVCQETRSTASLVQDTELGQLLLEPTCASDYIVCLWINFSAKAEAPVYNSKDTELSELVSEYLSRILNNIKMVQLSEFRSSLYLHLKLVRNFTQFLDMNMINLISDENWIESLSNVAIHLLKEDYQSLALIEILGILGNLLLSLDQTATTKRAKPEPELVLLLVNLLDLLEGKYKQQLNTEQDDLLLVSVLVVARLAKSREICPQFNGTDKAALVGRLVEASSSLLSSRPSDTELILSTLYALIQLMGHYNYLLELSSSQLTWELSCGQLAGELANLASHGDRSVSKLSIQALNWLSQLESTRKQSGERIRRIRFVAYNGKWMSAIRASGQQQTIQLDDKLTGGDAAAAAATAGYWDEDEDELLLTMREEDKGKSAIDGDVSNFEHLRELSGNSGNCCLSNRQFHNNRTDKQHEHDDYDKDDDNFDENDYEDKDEFEDIEDDERADLNVIDSNSMIKHLTSRREFRSLAERNQLSVVHQLDR